MAEITKVKFKFKFKEEYNPVFITGAQGGFTSTDMLVINFYQEREPLPKTITYDVKDNNINDVIDITPKQEKNTIDILRFIETGITCNLQTAISIRDWLTEQIDNEKVLKTDKVLKNDK